MYKSVFLKIKITTLLILYIAPLNMIILIFPLENTDDKKHSWVSAGMTYTVISDLGKIENINERFKKDMTIIAKK